MTGGLSRRELLRGLWRADRGDAIDERRGAGGGGAGGAEPVRVGARTARSRAAVPILRPPGAIEEARFLDACTRCSDCADACPHGAITRAPARFRGAAGTPWIDPVTAPCRLCEERPCATACTAGCIEPEAQASMGTALILTQSCLAYQGTFCSSCAEHCPVPGAVVLDRGRPQVVQAACTGCGICQFVCPAPQNSVLIRPRRGGGAS